MIKATTEPNSRYNEHQNIYVVLQALTSKTEPIKHPAVKVDPFCSINSNLLSPFAAEPQKFIFFFLHSIYLLIPSVQREALCSCINSILLFQNSFQILRSAWDISRFTEELLRHFTNFFQEFPCVLFVVKRPFRSLEKFSRVF